MPFTSAYTTAENDLLLEDMRTKGSLDGADFKMYEELWEGLFKVKRSAHGLYKQTKRLQKNYNLSMVFTSIPHTPKKSPIQINTVTNHKVFLPCPKQTSKRNKFRLQLDYLIRVETDKCIKRIVSVVEALTKEVLLENQELLEELKTLRPYKNTVENHFKKDLTL